MSNLPETPANMIHNIALTPTFSYEGVAYAASQGGLYKTTDQGRTWNLITEPVPVTTVIATLNMVIAGSVGQIVKSQNKGKSWVAQPLPIATSLSSALALHGDVLLLGTLYDGIFRSGNHGVTWEAWNTGLTNLSVLSIAITPQGAVYVGTEAGLFIRQDDDDQWRQTTENIQSAILSLVASEQGLYIATEEGELIFLSFEDDSQTTLFRSHDNAIDDVALNFNDKLAIIDGGVIRVSHDKGQTWETPDTEEDAFTIEWATDKTLVIGTVNGRIGGLKL